ncbi:iron-sulfur cluster repair di-iron protein [Pirellulales bacterium]|nr:iron-sulfur cluster repair di-iron protein [Pirellulales bacterium]
MPNINTTVGDWVTEHPQTSRVFESLQLDYCCGGDKPLAQACLEKELDPQQVIAKLEALLQREDSASTDWTSASMTQLCDHIEQTHHAYLKEELPLLTEVVAKVTQVHGQAHPELAPLQQQFVALRDELLPHMFKEEQVLFPAIRQLEQSEQAASFPFGSITNPIHMMEHEHDNAGDALKEIRSLSADFAVPENACNTYRAMLSRLQHLELDMHQHVHKENNILFPRAMKLEASR